MYRNSDHSKLCVLFLFIFLNFNLISIAQSNYNVYSNYSPYYLQKEGSPEHSKDFEDDNFPSRNGDKLQAHDKDLQVDPTYQKTFYVNYRPRPPRRRLLPYFILGFAAGSAGILGGAAAAGALRG